MKKFLLFVILSTVLFSCKTMEMGPKATPDQLTYSEIIELPNITQDELYIKANSWFVDNFNDAESVIQFQDKEAGKLMGKYVTSAKMSI